MILYADLLDLVLFVALADLVGDFDPGVGAAAGGVGAGVGDFDPGVGAVGAREGAGVLASGLYLKHVTGVGSFGSFADAATWPVPPSIYPERLLGLYV